MHVEHAGQHDMPGGVDAAGGVGGGEVVGDGSDGLADDANVGADDAARRHHVAAVDDRVEGHNESPKVEVQNPR